MTAAVPPVAARSTGHGQRTDRVPGEARAGAHAVAVEAAGWGWRHAGRETWAVRDVSFRVEPGQRVLLLGASGSGKSTLLRGLAGVLGDEEDGESEGELRIGGVAPDEARGTAGLVLQDPDAQVVLARVGDDVAFGCENLGVPREEIWRRVPEALAAVGLPLPLDHPTSALSGGQKQRLALAGALAMHPGLMLLDEPTAQLDPRGIVEVRDAVLDATTRSTLVVVEHRVDAWAPHVDRVIVLGGQGVLADGEPARVFADHAEALDAAGVWVPASARTPVAERSGAAAEMRRPSEPTVVPEGTPDPAAVPADHPATPVAERSGVAAEMKRPSEPTAAPEGTPDPAAVSAWDAGSSLARIPRAEHPAAPVAERSGVAAEMKRPSETTVAPDGAPEPAAASPDPRPMLAASGLGVGRPGAPPAARGIDVWIRPGRALAVVGANGAGKTTLALTLAGLLAEAEGEVRADPGLVGALPRRPRPWRRPRDVGRPHAWASRELLTRIGMVFQSPEHQLLTSTVRAELEVGPRALGLDEEAVRARIDPLLDRLRLRALATANPFTLSGGEKRRLTVAAALATRPRVLVLDEPTFGQDARTWRELVGLLAELRDAGTALVLVTHDEALVATLADDVLRLGPGDVLRRRADEVLRGGGEDA